MTTVGAVDKEENISLDIEDSLVAYLEESSYSQNTPVDLSKIPACYNSVQASKEVEIPCKVSLSRESEDALSAGAKSYVSREVTFISSTEAGNYYALTIIGDEEGESDQEWTSFTIEETGDDNTAPEIRVLTLANINLSLENMSQQAEILAHDEEQDLSLAVADSFVAFLPLSYPVEDNQTLSNINSLSQEQLMKVLDRLDICQSPSGLPGITDPDALSSEYKEVLEISGVLPPCKTSLKEVPLATPVAGRRMFKTANLIFSEDTPTGDYMALAKLEDEEGLVAIDWESFTVTTPSQINTAPEIEKVTLNEEITTENPVQEVKTIATDENFNISTRVADSYVAYLPMNYLLSRGSSSLVAEDVLASNKVANLPSASELNFDRLPLCESPNGTGSVGNADALSNSEDPVTVLRKALPPCKMSLKEDSLVSPDAESGRMVFTTGKLEFHSSIAAGDYLTFVRIKDTGGLVDATWDVFEVVIEEEEENTAPSVASINVEDLYLSGNMEQFIQAQVVDQEQNLDTVVAYLYQEEFSSELDRCSIAETILPCQTNLIANSSGSYESAVLPVSINTAAGSYYVTVLATDSEGEEGNLASDFQVHPASEPPPPIADVTLNLTIPFQDRDNDPNTDRGDHSGVVSLALYENTASSPVYTVQFTTDTYGKATVDLGKFQLGNYIAAVKTAQHLSKAIDVTLVEGVNDIAFSYLLAGDISGDPNTVFAGTNDDVINAVDITELYAYWGAVVSNSDYSTITDIDLNGEVGAEDFSNLIAHSGETGDLYLE